LAGAVGWSSTAPEADTVADGADIAEELDIPQVKTSEEEPLGGVGASVSEVSEGVAMTRNDRGGEPTPKTGGRTVHPLVDRVSGSSFRRLWRELYRAIASEVGTALCPGRARPGPLGHAGPVGSIILGIIIN